MAYGNKGVSISAVLLVVVIIAATIFIFQSNYNIPKPPIEAKASNPVATDDVFQQENASSENNTVAVSQTTVGNETTNATENATQSTVVSVSPAEPEPTINHVIISEIKTAGDEFVELYNPTNADVDLTGWKLAFYSPINNWNEPTWITSIKGGTIKSDGYYLIGGYGYSTKADSALPINVNAPSAGKMTNIYGAIAVLSGDITGLSVTDAKLKKVDSVTWGDASVENSFTVKEGSISPVIYAQQSLERKSDTEHNETYIDTDNNLADFAVTSLISPRGTA